MAIPAGSRIGAYEVTGSLGAGGMGEVYRARDTRLNREVALKVLPDTFAADPDRLARFQREAQLLATLNHPHIGAIYGFEEGRALVLELVEGPTLADRIVQGAIPIEDAIPIARQIAEALEAAHDKGIIHRDLKPANIKVTPAGKVKVLDFGLAKLNDPHAKNDPNGPNASNDPNVLTMSPTILSPGRMTSVGLILGTAAYMAPEQARGREVDRRADIWAFGCVLYEMLTGRQPFPGESIGEIVSEVLKSEPDWQRLPPETPVHVRRLLARCLQKDPARRLHHIADARIELDDVSAVPVAPASASAKKHALPWMVAAAGLVIAATAVGWAVVRGASGEARVSPTRLEFNIPPGVELFTATTQALAVSPDGSLIAFVGVGNGTRAVYVRRLDQFEATPIRGSEGATTCFFASDSRSVGLVDAAGVVKLINLADGTVSVATGEASFIAGVAAGPDRVVFVRDGSLWQVRVPGGTPSVLAAKASKDREVAMPSFLPGDETVLFAAASLEGQWRIDAIVVATGERRTVVPSGTMPRYVSTGHLVFYRDNELFAAPFDPDALEQTGPAVRMLDLPVSSGEVPDVDVSRSGTLVFAPQSEQSRLVWVARDGAEQPLSDDRRPYLNPRLSHDGNSLLVQAGDIWISDLRRAAFTRLDSTDSVGFAIWTPDASQVVFKTSTDLRRRNADGSGVSEVIAGTGPFDYPSGFTPDGRTLVIMRSSQKTSYDVVTLPFPAGGEITPILATPAYEGGARLSRDGRWLTYISNDSGRNEVYVRPFPGPDRRIKVSTDGGTQPTWGADGKTIYYRSGDRMMAVSVSGGEDLTLSPPQTLFERQFAFGAGITIANYDSTSDSQRFVMVKDESTAGRVNVVLNWAAELIRATESAP